MMNICPNFHGIISSLSSLKLEMWDEYAHPSSCWKSQHQILFAMASFDSEDNSVLVSGTIGQNIDLTFLYLGAHY